MNPLKTLADKYYGPTDVTRKPPHYLKTYHELFSSARDQPIRLLELGVHRGASIAIWCDYFHKAQAIVGLDVGPRPDDFPTDPRAHFVRGSQADLKTLQLAATHGPFDIIIDDAAHVGHLAKASLRYLFPECLKQGGFYVLEDWGVALTHPKWADAYPYETKEDTDRKFPSYEYGMIGLVKQVIDEMVLRGLNKERMDVGPMHIQPGITIIEKKIPGVTSRISLTARP